MKDDMIDIDTHTKKKKKDGIPTLRGMKVDVF